MSASIRFAHETGERKTIKYAIDRGNLVDKLWAYHSRDNDSHAMHSRDNAIKCAPLAILRPVDLLWTGVLMNFDCCCFHTRVVHFLAFHTFTPERCTSQSTACTIKTMPKLEAKPIASNCRPLLIGTTVALIYLLLVLALCWTECSSDIIFAQATNRQRNKRISLSVYYFIRALRAQLQNILNNSHTRAGNHVERARCMHMFEWFASPRQVQSVNNIYIGLPHPVVCTTVLGTLWAGLCIPADTVTGNESNLQVFLRFSLETIANPCRRINAMAE